METNRLRAVPLRSVTSKLGRREQIHASEESASAKRAKAEGKLGGRRERREGLHSLLNQTCSGNSAHQRRQPVKNILICHLISNNSASICRALNPHGFAALNASKETGQNRGAKRPLFFRKCTVILRNCRGRVARPGYGN